VADPQKVSHDQLVVATRLRALPRLDWAGVAGLDEAAWQSLLTALDQDLLSPDFEVVLTDLRRALLMEARALPADGRVLTLLGGLASFCYETDYVLAETQAETALVAALNPARSVTEQLLHGCYRADGPLDLPCDDVPVLGRIADSISRQVQAQYEENPYPRWRDLDVARIPKNQDRQTILIAGCGSGRQPIMTAVGAPDSLVFGIDLSRTSLAYGLMKARDYGVDNVRFAQMDLLDVGQLGAQFDAISCVGVLHHMAEPLAGLMALKGALAPGGQLKLALYSATGRAGILAAIKYREERGAAPTPEGIRAFRQDIYRLPAWHPARFVLSASDFYSLSGARDLLFHVQERNYTLDSLRALIDGSGLRLQQFVASPEATALFRRAGFRDPLDFDGWRAVERENPLIFGSMYRVILTL